MVRVYLIEVNLRGHGTGVSCGGRYLRGHDTGVLYRDEFMRECGTCTARRVRETDSILARTFKGCTLFMPDRNTSSCGVESVQH